MALGAALRVRDLGAALSKSGAEEGAVFLGLPREGLCENDRALGLRRGRDSLEKRPRAHDVGAQRSCKEKNVY